ncbi:hypothetical protein GCM10023235_74600 [Kitasatospora terrestris]|uniref:Uncharacterized protein n=1 Tax=Kitasatospora terrestris TaxID=258051 RepID=A0ABP9ENR7_9ACTN
MSPGEGTGPTRGRTAARYGNGRSITGRLPRRGPSHARALPRKETTR